jgi:hypothetical protein
MITFSVFGTQYSAMAQMFRTGLQTPSSKKNVAMAQTFRTGLQTPSSKTGLQTPSGKTFTIHHSPFIQ